MCPKLAALKVIKQMKIMHMTVSKSMSCFIAHQMKRQLAININTSELRVKNVAAAALFPGVGPPASGMTSPSGATSANAGLVMIFVIGVPIEVT